MHARNEEKNLEALTVFFLVCTSISRVDRGRHARKNLSFWETYSMYVQRRVLCSVRDRIVLAGRSHSILGQFVLPVFQHAHTAVLGKSQTKSNESSMAMAF